MVSDSFRISEHPYVAMANAMLTLPNAPASEWLLQCTKGSIIGWEYRRRSQVPFFRRNGGGRFSANPGPRAGAFFFDAVTFWRERRFSPGTRRKHMPSSTAQKQRDIQKEVKRADRKGTKKSASPMQAGAR